MSREVFINAIPGETRLAVTEDGKLVDLVFARAHENSILGNIYLGRIEKVIFGMNAAFIDIGLPASGFLAAVDGQIFDRDREKPKPIGELFKEGDSVVIQVTREASEGKGAKLTTRLNLTGRNVVVTPDRPGISISKSISNQVERERLEAALQQYAHSSLGLIVRTRAQMVSAEDLQREAEFLTGTYLDIEASQKTMKPPACVYEEADAVSKYLKDRGDSDWQKIVVDDRAILDKLLKFCADTMPELAALFELAEDQAALFETHDLEEQIEDLFQLQAALPSGGYLIIEETAALVAIDVDSGAHIRDRDPEALAMAVNEEAAIEAARQIHLRNLSGQIVVDFLPLKRRDSRDKIQYVLSAALAEDTTKSNIFGFSRLGLMEMTRQRNGESLAARFISKNQPARSIQSVAIDMIRAVLRELDRNPGKVLTVQCGARLHVALTGEMQATWQSLLDRTGPVVVLEKRTALAGAEFDINTTKN
ncbi:MAG: Rne/Rng family ribonuclease [Rhodospirillales bacterium]